MLCGGTTIDFDPDEIYKSRPTDFFLNLFGNRAI
jgi:hypothetical protein